jgi:hypothetical protein
VDDRELARLLRHVEPSGRKILRRLMRSEQWERNEYARALMSHPGAATDLGDLLDLASMNPEVRRRVARVLGEIEAGAP